MAFVRQILKTRSKSAVFLLAPGTAGALSNPLPAPTRPPVPAPLSSSSAPGPSSSSYFSFGVSPHSILFPHLSGRAPLSIAEQLFLSCPVSELSRFSIQLRLLGEDAKGTRGRLSDKEFAVRFVAKEQEVRPGGSVGRRSHIGRNELQEDGLLNLPNMISISRMVSGPLIAWMIFNGWYSYSFLALTVAGVTDWLDGFAARKMRINSVLGSYLDPLADKVLIGCVAVAMVEKDLLQSWIVLLVVLRDVLLVSGVVYKRASMLGWQWKGLSDFVNLNSSHPERVHPLFVSKVNTVFQLILVAAALLQPDFGTDQTLPYITYLSWLVASTTVASTMAYGVQYIRSRAAICAR